MIWRWQDYNTGKLCRYDDEDGIKVLTWSSCGRQTTIHKTPKGNYVAMYTTSWEGERDIAALWSEQDVLEQLALRPETATPAGRRLLEQKDICQEV